MDELEVGEPVEREDGRFYIPISHMAPTELSPIVCRVASDAFPSVALAQFFAHNLVNIYNNAGRHDG